MTTTTSPDRTTTGAHQTSIQTVTGAVAQGSSAQGSSAQASSTPSGRGGPEARPPRAGRGWRDGTRSLIRTHGRVLAITLIALAVIALAIPVGLARLSGGGGAGSEASTVGVAPGQVERDASGAGGSAGAPGLSDSSGAARPAAGSGTAGSPQAPNDSAKAGGSLLTPQAAAALDATKIARTAWIGLQVTDLAGSAGRARIIATSAGGTVLSEDVVTAVDPVGAAKGVASGTGPDGIPTDVSGVTGSGGTTPPVGLHEARLTLSVPAEKLDGVLTQLSALGTVSFRSAQAEDVTATYVDTQARIEPARDSITRVRALMAKATDLQQLLVLESELTRRQSDLDALTQQLADLDKRTTMSEVTVTMWTPAAASVVDDGTDVGGLRGAWEALLGSLSLVLTGLAVLLPWLLLIGLGALIALRVVQRRRRTTATSTPTTSTPTSTLTTSASSGTSSGTTENPAPVGPAATAPLPTGSPTTPPSTD